MRLPNNYIEKLNELGFGGRLIYVPLLRKTTSDIVYEDMLKRAQQGKHIDLENYRNTVSMRTLYRLKQKAIKEAHYSRGDNNGK